MKVIKGAEKDNTMFESTKERRKFQYWDNQEFIKAWMSSDSVEEAASKLGRNTTATSQKATQLRAKGVALPRMENRHNPNSVESLNKLVKKLSK